MSAGLRDRIIPVSILYMGMGMTKVLHCGDLVPGCTFEARGETEDEVLSQAAVHAEEAHGLDATPELVGKVKLAIHDE